MKKILAFTGSNHSQSINRQVLQFALSLIDANRFDVTEINLTDFEPVMFSLDIERKHGIPKQTTNLLELMKQFDGYIIASPEHNGSVPAFLKNIIDWLSREDRKFFNDKPLLLLSTSDGANAAKTNLNLLAESYPRFGAKVTGTYSLPNFSENFKDKEIINSTELDLLKTQISIFENSF